MTELVAILDIGKTTARLILVEPATGQPVHVARRRNAPASGPVRQLDIAALQDWLLNSLAACPDRTRIRALVPVAHGAACVMLDEAGAVALAPDYEDPAFEQEGETYARLRDEFSRTYSPLLPLGLNLGRQIFHVQRRLPALYGRVATLLPYAQFWAWWLSGVAASEITSLGCHTDLWSPADGGFAPLAHAQGWDRLFPGLRPASDVLGAIRPKIAARCGLDPACVVLCGIHDSNASYLQHRLHRPADEPFSVISSGTWTVLFSSHTALSRLRQERDMLANIDASGRVVGTARFMGGREYEAVAGAGNDAVPDEAALARVLASRAIVRPAFTAGGQFAGRVGRIIGADDLDAAARAALASLHVAFLTDVALDLLEARGDIVIDGPLAENLIYPAILAALRPASRVRLCAAGTGTTGGALGLAVGSASPRPVLRDAPMIAAPAAFEAHANRWRGVLAELCR